VEDLGDLVHCRECKEIVVLLLSDEENRDASRLSVVGWVLLEQLIDLLVVLLSEFERSVLIVVLRVTVVRECAERAGSSQESGLLRHESSETGQHLY